MYFLTTAETGIMKMASQTISKLGRFWDEEFREL
jgi:hypothetical protein